MIIKMWKGAPDLMGWWQFHDLWVLERRIFSYSCSLILSQKKGKKVDRLQNEIKFANFYNLLPQLMQLKTKNFDTTIFEDEVVFYQQKMYLLINIAIITNIFSYLKTCMSQHIDKNGMHAIYVDI